MPLSMTHFMHGVATSASATLYLAALLCTGCEQGSDSAAPTDVCLPDAGPYICRVVDFAPGQGAGYGQDAFPDVVYGPPQGSAEGSSGGLDVLSLGAGGEITVELGQTVVDGPGVDFIVFENPFAINGTSNIYKEFGAVSVSMDGEAFTTLPCDVDNYTLSHCAGWHIVLSSPENGIPATDPNQAGGDLFDLADLGLTEIRFVRIHDLAMSGAGDKAGFDLDAIAVVNGE